MESRKFRANTKVNCNLIELLRISLGFNWALNMLVCVFMFFTFTVIFKTAI